MEEVLKTFDINEEKFLNIKEEITFFIKSYFNEKMEKDSRNHFYYLESLDSECNEYLQFGADKCDVDNFNEFCKDLDINVEENLLRIIDELNEEIKIKTDIKNNSYKEENYPLSSNSSKRYVFNSRDKKITFTCSKPGNYMHYFGITGESNKILDAFKIFKKRCTYDDASFGARDYI